MEMEIFVKKYTSILITLIAVNLHANENWITIEPIVETQTPKAQKQETALDVNLSQIEPIHKMMKNINLIQQVIKATTKREKKRETPNNKKWFVINAQTK